MSDEPREPRPAPRDGGSPLAWALPLALTGLVIVLAWKLYQSLPKSANDPRAQPRTVAARGDLADDEKATIALFHTASPAVVQVTAYLRGADASGSHDFVTARGSGSGFVWDPQGYVVTNFHVVGVGDSWSVTFPSHDVLDAELAGFDKDHDLAVLKVDARGKTLPALPLGRSNELQVGQKVFAIGNPFGLDQTLTTGIISGLNREIASLEQTPIQGVIQTDAAINPGNSGGPLLDSAGRVIGLNTQIASTSGSSSGVGFAIPVDLLNKVVPQIIRTGHAVRPGIGVGGSLAGTLTRTGQKGVVFNTFTTASGAKAAGLRPSTYLADGRVGKLGDVIVGVDGQTTETPVDMIRILDTREIGNEVEVRFVRDGAEQTVKVKLVGLE